MLSNPSGHIPTSVHAHFPGDKYQHILSSGDIGEDGASTWGQHLDQIPRTSTLGAQSLTGRQSVAKLQFLVVQAAAT